MGFSQKAKGKGEEKQVYLTSLGNAISLGFFEIKKCDHQPQKPYRMRV